MIDVPVYITFSREDPHYAEFYKLYCKDHFFRTAFNRDVLAISQKTEQEKFWLKWTIARLFESKYKDIIDLDVQGLYSEVYEDYRSAT